MDEIVLQIRKKDGSPITLEDVQKILKEKGIIDEAKFTQEDIDRLFNKIEEKVMEFSNLLKFMEEIASETKANITELHGQIVASIPETGVSEAFKDTALTSIKELQIKMKENIITNNIDISLEKIKEWFSNTEMFSNENQIEDNPAKEQEKTNKECEDGRSLTKEELQKFFEEISTDDKINVDEFKKKFDEWSKKKNGK